LENPPDWKESSHRLQIQDNEDIRDIDPIMGKQNKCESRTGEKFNMIAETEEEHNGLAKFHRMQCGQNSQS